MLLLSVATGAALSVYFLGFAFFNSPLPVAGSNDLYSLSAIDQKKSSNVFTKAELAQMLRYANGITSAAGLCEIGKIRLEVQGEIYFANALVYAGDLFSTLKLVPAEGSLSGNDESGAIVVSSHLFQQLRLTRQRDALGTVRLGRHLVDVRGVLPPSFVGVIRGAPTDVYLSLNTYRLLSDAASPVAARTPEERLQILCRLKSAVSVIAAEDNILSVFTHMPHAGDVRNWRANSFSIHLDRARYGLRERILRQYGLSYLILEWLSASLIALSCVTASILLTTGLAGRSREFATRLALGGSHGHLFWLSAAELSIIGLCSFACGACFTLLATNYLILPILKSMGAEVLPVDLKSMMLFDLLATTILSTTCYLAPFLWLLRGRIGTGSSLEFWSKDESIRRLGKYALLCQIALSVSITASAFLLLRSFAQLWHEERGYELGQVALWEFSSADIGHESADIAAIYEQLSLEVSMLPGVTSATISHVLPIDDTIALSTKVLEVDARPIDASPVKRNVVGPSYFLTFGMQRLQGRDFTLRDRVGAEPVVIISKSLARSWFPNANAVDKQIACQPGGIMTIVGVVEDSKYGSLRAPREGLLFTPILQSGVANLLPIHLSVKYGGVTLESLRKEVRLLLAGRPLERETTLLGETSASVTKERVLGQVASLFAIYGMWLCALGNFSLVLYDAQRRAKEIAIRIAIGANIRALTRQVTREQVVNIILGCAIGFGMFIASAKLLGHFLYNTRPGEIDVFLVPLVVTTSTILGSTLVGLSVFVKARDVSEALKSL